MNLFERILILRYGGGVKRRGWIHKRDEGEKEKEGRRI
jgi:hypothetical protein